MERPGQLSAFQVEIAEIFFALEESAGFLVAGGAALLASELIQRPTEDLDLFTATPTTSVTAAKDALVASLADRDVDVVVIQDGPTFCRLVVSRPVGEAGEETLVDLAIDSPPHARPTMTVLGPTLAPIELAGRKLLALFSRAEARDFADVYLLANRFGTETLLDEAAALDPGFDAGVLAQMLGSIRRFEDDEIPLGGEVVPLARKFFMSWADDLR